jgi:hypothetical protein
LVSSSVRWIVSYCDIENRRRNDCAYDIGASPRLQSDFISFFAALMNSELKSPFLDFDRSHRNMHTSVRISRNKPSNPSNHPPFLSITSIPVVLTCCVLQIWYDGSSYDGFFNHVASLKCFQLFLAMLFATRHENLALSLGSGNIMNLGFSVFPLSMRAGFSMDSGIFLDDLPKHKDSESNHKISDGRGNISSNSNVIVFCVKRWWSATINLSWWAFQSWICVVEMISPPSTILPRPARRDNQTGGRRWFW